MGVAGRSIVEAAAHLNEGETEPSELHLGFVRAVIAHRSFDPSKINSALEVAIGHATKLGNVKVAEILREAAAHANSPRPRHS